MGTGPIVYATRRMNRNLPAKSITASFRVPPPARGIVRGPDWFAVTRGFGHTALVVASSDLLG